MHNASARNKATALLLLSAIMIVTGCSSTITTTQTLTSTLATTLTSTIPPVTTTLTSTTTDTATLYETTTLYTAFPRSTVTTTLPTTVYPAFPIGGFQVISQDSAVAGATVSVNITNPYPAKAKFTVILRLDGKEIERTEILVERTDVVSFNVDRDISVFTLKTEGNTAIIEATSDAKLPNGYILEKKLDYVVPMAKTYEITYISDGLRVKGYLSLPTSPSFGPILPGRHPAIIFCRGGNKNYGAIEASDVSYYTQLLGYVAVGSQYRGNMGGQGQDQFGGGDVNDVVNLIPLLKSLPEVDPDHIGLVGASRGGMMAYMTLRKQTLAGTNDIKVAVIVSGSADLFFAAQKQSDMLNGVFIPLIGGTPQQLPKEYEARSAVYWANDINVPILLQHGDQDVHVYIDEANKMAAELQKYGKNYKYTVYPGRGHDLFGLEQARTELLTWLKSYLQ
jgi:dipeptidyl aminopeptidase/acylaminoacyl peptidase